MIKGLVFAGDVRSYKAFLRCYNVSPQEYRFVFREQDLLGYHKDTNSDLRILFLDRWYDSPVLTTDAYQVLRAEFRGMTYLPDSIVLALIDGIDDPAELPVFLASADENVRETAKKRLLKLEGLEIPEVVGDSHFTKLIRGPRGKAQVLPGPPQAITRAIPGSQGRETYITSLKYPDDEAHDWLNDLKSTNLSPSPETGYGRWSGIQTKLDAISDTKSPVVLPQYLVDENDVIREAAREKLEELK